VVHSSIAGWVRFDDSEGLEIRSRKIENKKMQPQCQGTRRVLLFLVIYNQPLSSRCKEGNRHAFNSYTIVFAMM